MGYDFYRLCMAIGYAAARGSLAGFLPALPLAVRAQRAESRKLRWLWEGLAFVVYFWTSGMLPGWKEEWSD